MLSTLEFRLCPDDEQKIILKNQLRICTGLDNRTYHERLEHYWETGRGLTYAEQQNALLDTKKAYQGLTTIYSQVLQDVLRRLDTSFKNFFGGRTKYPHTKKYVSSMTYPQASQKWIFSKSIVLPKIGRIRMIKHRAVKGKVKTATVRKYNNEGWHAIIAVETKDIAMKAAQEIKNSVGIDSGLTDFIYLSDNTRVDNPGFVKLHKLLLAKRWQDYDNVKDDWLWKLANVMVSRYDFIAYEDLFISNMMKEHSFARAIQDATWSGFWDKVEWKAKLEGTFAIPVDPKYSSQECPVHHIMCKITLSERTFLCHLCDYTAQRDFQAGVIILRRALVRIDMSEFTPAEVPTAGHQMDITHVLLKQVLTPPTNPNRVIAAWEAHEL